MLYLDTVCNRKNIKIPDRFWLFDSAIKFWSEVPDNLRNTFIYLYQEEICHTVILACFSANSVPLSPMASGVVQKGSI